MATSKSPFKPGIDQVKKVLTLMQDWCNDGDFGKFIQGLKNLNGFPERTALHAIANHFGVPVIQIENVEVTEEVLALIPVATAMEHQVLPITKQGTTLILAMARPEDHETIERVARMTGLKVEVVLADPMLLKHKIEEQYGLPPF